MRYLVPLILINIFVSTQAFAASRGAIVLFGSQSALDGEPTSEDSTSISFYTGGMRYKEKNGFGVGLFYMSQYDSAEIEKAGFGLESGKNADFDMTTLGLQFGYLFPSNTEISLGFGNKVIRYSQGEVSANAGATDYRIGFSQTVFKEFGVSLFASQTENIRMRSATTSYDTKITSYGIGAGYFPIHD